MTFRIPAEHALYVRLSIAELLRGMTIMHRDLWQEAIGRGEDSDLQALAASENKIVVTSQLYLRVLAAADGLGDGAGEIAIETASSIVQVVLEELVRGVIPFAHLRLASEKLDERRTRELSGLRPVEAWALSELAALRAIQEEWAPQTA